MPASVIALRPGCIVRSLSALVADRQVRKVQSLSAPVADRQVRKVRSLSAPVADRRVRKAGQEGRPAGRNKVRAWGLSPRFRTGPGHRARLCPAMNPAVSFQVAALCAGVFAAFMGAGKGSVSCMDAFVFFQG